MQRAEQNRQRLSPHLRSYSRASLLLLLIIRLEDSSGFAFAHLHSGRATGDRGDLRLEARWLRFGRTEGVASSREPCRVEIKMSRN